MKQMNEGRFFEDFRLGETIVHATPRTLSEGDSAVYQALYGTRHLLQSSRPHAEKCGFKDRPIDDWLVFHIVFGKTVPDISRHAIANLGYAEGVFHAPVFAGDTLSAVSEIIGVRQNANAKSGIVMVRSTGHNQHDETILRYVRWVMVLKRAPDSPAPETHMPVLDKVVSAEKLHAPRGDFNQWDMAAAGSTRAFDDFKIGERMVHGGGMTLEEAEHMLATRLYQNTAQVHFDALAQRDTRFEKRLIYGGHMISHARAMSFNGFENACLIAALNGGKHVAPAFAGDTVYGWSEILDKAEIANRKDVGALRLRHVLVKNCGIEALVDCQPDDPAVILDLDCWVWMVRS